MNMRTSERTVPMSRKLLHQHIIFKYPYYIGIITHPTQTNSIQRTNFFWTCLKSSHTFHPKILPLQQNPQLIGTFSYPTNIVVFIVLG